MGLVVSVDGRLLCLPGRRLGEKGSRHGVVLAKGLWVMSWVCMCLLFSVEEDTPCFIAYLGVALERVGSAELFCMREEHTLDVDMFDAIEKVV